MGATALAGGGARAHAHTQQTRSTAVCMAHCRAAKRLHTMMAWCMLTFQPFWARPWTQVPCPPSPTPPPTPALAPRATVASTHVLAPMPPRTTPSAEEAAATIPPAAPAYQVAAATVLAQVASAGQQLHRTAVQCCLQRTNTPRSRSSPKASTHRGSCQRSPARPQRSRSEEAVAAQAGTLSQGRRTSATWATTWAGGARCSLGS
mmetsp:Transcript_12809/g.34938  ORF Transcript_12809/g.34938 Transcript_12809/m.34938 type:complete len:205 (-) Transcript_12809:99-713(-)